MIFNTKQERKKRETHKRWNMQKAMNEMENLNPNILIMTLNVNRLNSPHKDKDYEPQLKDSP